MGVFLRAGMHIWRGAREGCHTYGGQRALIPLPSFLNAWRVQRGDAGAPKYIGRVEGMCVGGTEE